MNDSTVTDAAMKQPSTPSRSRSKMAHSVAFTSTLFAKRATGSYVQSVRKNMTGKTGSKDERHIVSESWYFTNPPCRTCGALVAYRQEERFLGGQKWLISIGFGCHTCHSPLCTACAATHNWEDWLCQA